MRSEIFVNGILIAVFLVIGFYLFISFSPQHEPMPISELFRSQIPVVVAVLIYLTVMGTRKVMEGE